VLPEVVFKYLSAWGVGVESSFLLQEAIKIRVAIAKRFLVFIGGFFNVMQY
jgi:hypothetical protein